MALHKKVEPFMGLNPDIAIIPECAEPEVVKKKASKFEFNDAVWIDKSRTRDLVFLRLARLLRSSHRSSALNLSCSCR